MNSIVTCAGCPYGCAMGAHSREAMAVQQHQGRVFAVTCSAQALTLRVRAAEAEAALL